MAELRNGELKPLLEPLLKRSEAYCDKERKRLFVGYFSDIWESLKGHHRCLRKKGYQVLVIGNSLHGNSDRAYLIPTDIVVATMARCLGFSVEGIMVARKLKRRLPRNHFLRESVIVLRKE